MGTIGLIAAIPEESQALLRAIHVWEPARVGELRGYRFELSGRECLLIQSGIGLKRAIQTARALLAAARPQLLVTFGIAGAVNADLQVGDVVVAGRSCLLEQGIPGQFRPLVSLPADAWRAAEQVLAGRSARLFSGTALTTRGSQFVQPGRDELAHPILEMETAGIAQVAAEEHIALLALRAISDGPQAPLPFDPEAITDKDYHLRIGVLLKELIRHPGIILQARRINRNVRTAADNAALCLVAALSQSSPVV